MGQLSFSFVGRTALITGAARGIGLDLATFFAATGARTFAVDLPDAPMEEAAGHGRDPAGCRGHGH